MSATNNKLFLLLGFSLLLHHEIEGITTHSVTGCSFNVLLNCSITEMIHVERITYYNGTDCNQAVTDLQVCGQPLTGSDTGLVPACDGNTFCSENINYNTCPGSRGAKLDYRCIPGINVKDMCNPFIIKHIDRIFLSTSNYPLAPTFTYISPCRCFIRGSSITSIQILEFVLHTSNGGNKSSLEINYGDVTYKTESFSNTTSRRVYNKRLSTTSTSAEITLNHSGSNEHYLWIEVQGVVIYVSCTIVTPFPTTTTSPSPTPDSTSQTADIKSQSQGITTHSVTGCSDSVVLNCPNTEMIHVERITFYNGTDCNQAVTDLQVCGQPLTGSETGLIPACNGKLSCNENLYYSFCPGSKAAKVDYRCILDSNVKDMCDSFVIKHIDRIFLSTPNYPSSPTFTDISACRCFIRGSRITFIQILERRLLPSNDGKKSSLEIKYGYVTYKTESYSAVFNERLSTTSTTAEITLNHSSSNKHYLWIEVQGVAMYVSCTIVTPLPSTTTSQSTTPDSTSPTADIGSQSQGKDTTIIILGVLLSLCILIICITAFVIIVLLRRESNRLKKQQKRTQSAERLMNHHPLVTICDSDRNSPSLNNASLHSH